MKPCRRMTLKKQKFKEDMVEPPRYRMQFGGIATEVVGLTNGLTKEQFNWKPEPDSWSVGQCIDHLNRAGYALLPLFEKAIHGGRQNGMTGEPPFQYDFVSRWFIRFNEPTSNFKMKTFKLYAPATDHHLEKHITIESFAELQSKLADKAEKSQGLNLRKIKVPSPVSHMLRINLGAWFEATIAHERRHLKQIQGIMQNPGFPSSRTTSETAT